MACQATHRFSGVKRALACHFLFQVNSLVPKEWKSDACSEKLWILSFLNADSAKQFSSAYFLGYFYHSNIKNKL